MQLFKNLVEEYFRSFPALKQGWTMGSKMMQVKGRCTLRRSCQFTAAGNADCCKGFRQSPSFLLGGCQ